MAAPLTARRSVVVISDWVDGQHPEHDRQPSSLLPAHAAAPVSQPWTGDLAPAEVMGGYLERLPLALVAAGIVDQAEIWHHWRGEDEPPFRRDNAVLARRAFRIDDKHAPFASSQMNAFVEAFGAPHILVVLGLGVAPELLALCANSIILYNSIDAPSLRVPPEVSEHFDLVITGAQWQSDEVEARHPGMRTAILPVGPEFAAIDQFRPLGTAKDVDLIYVAAAQPYKRHDILFDALAQLQRDIRALCVFGYGEDAEALRHRARDQNLSIEFIGPPGVPIDAVNRLMNRAKFGVVCGIDDGAPAILTEYMLAGLPVLANAELRCGLQFILPETGMTASTNGFADAILTMRETYEEYLPRQAVLERWTWQHSIVRLRAIIQQIHDAKQ
ncbi:MULTISPECIES: glycosyltransferase family 4 protein [unclassified Sphingomonas]|uniref:glycosyltransferase family 4 protein n=1 Tax=unclassified Sphingomonas TaxID=196159 RepID=UPI0006F8987C|nr:MULTISPECIES: glycosyltransferase family 4 protein [unclassified Sphingomonas]KQS51547.1 glycosyl transferase family 1 [Sphingomonas sp. Leaf198]